MADTDTFTFNSAVLMQRIEDIKRNPPPHILAYKAAHPEFKTVACELLAEYADVSVSTLKNLKLGKATDTSCSTLWLICRAFEIDPAALLGLPTVKACNPDACSSHAHARHADLQSRCAAADQCIADLHAALESQYEALGAANAKVDALERIIKQKDASIARRDKDIRIRNGLLIALFALIITLAIVSVIVL